MDFTTGISIFFNLLLIGAFIVDRIFRIKSIKEYKDAKEAQIVTLKERIDFLNTHNDEFLVNKFKSRIESLKSLIEENEDKPELQVKLLEFQETINLLKINNDILKEESENTLNQYREAAKSTSRILEAFTLIITVIDAKKQWHLFEEVKENIAERLGNLSESIAFRDIRDDF